VRNKGRSGWLLEKLRRRDELRLLDLLLRGSRHIEAVIRIACIHTVLHLSVLVPVLAFVGRRLILDRRFMLQEG
jgi:hypothetical protein